MNPNGDSCPYALLVMAVQLLNEITTFLRESHQHATRAQVVAASTSTGGSRSGDHGGQWEGGSNGRRNHTGTSGSTAMGALKSTRRRLSILMPMFAQAESKDKHGSTNIELSNVKGEDGDSATKMGDDYGNDNSRLSGFLIFSISYYYSYLLESGHPPIGTGSHTNRQISFAFNENDRDRSNSLQGSASSLELQNEVVEKPG